MFSLGAIIVAIAAFWVYNDARERGHDLGTALMWALGTLVMLIVFLPLYLILGRKAKMAKPSKPAIDIEGVPAEEILTCPMCAGKVRQDFKACPYCGHTLRPQCPQCGRELNRHWRVCPYCEAPAEPK